ncbi:MAG: hypothetical protein NWF01_03620 [Candidatus Bathyarchaeota archaeon]|nr:hypothetical protein [Candidatus Bathyarchaeota archaeon]
MEKTKDAVNWKTTWRIDKFKDQTGTIAKALTHGIPLKQAQNQFNAAFIGTEQFANNIALNEGLQELIDIICDLGTPTKWDNTNARIGVGDNNTAEAATQTGLQAETNKTFKQMDSGYPQRSGQTAEWRATFGSADANHAWEEFTVVNTADDSGKNLNRKTASKGTKSIGETWVLSLQMTFS